MFPGFIGDIFNSLDTAVREQINEIRLRKEKPVIIYIKDKAYFIDYSGKPVSKPNGRCVYIRADDFEGVCDRLCSHSYHTNMASLINGFVTAKNGSWVGVASSAVYRDGRLHSVRDITSLNIRISHEYKNCCRQIVKLICSDRLPSIIVAGKPGCGKTTFLRDYARILSDGYDGVYRKVAVIDERHELAADFDIGVNTNVLCGFEKAKGIEAATRTLSPDLIVCDEIGSPGEVKAVSGGFACGVSFAVSVHLKDGSNLFSNRILAELLDTGQFDYIVLLKSYTDEFEIINLGEVKNENARDIDDNPFFFLPWINGG